MLTRRLERTNSGYKRGTTPHLPPNGINSDIEETPAVSEEVLRFSKLVLSALAWDREKLSLHDVVANWNGQEVLGNFL